MPTSRDLDQRVYEVASGQAGMISRPQVIEVGGTDSYILDRIRQRRVQRIDEGVYLLAGAPDHPHSELWRCHLTAGLHSVVSHFSAAKLHQLNCPPDPLLHLTVARHPLHLRVRGARVHQIADLRDDHVTVVDGLPVTTAARTIVDLVTHVGRVRLGQVMDSGVLRNRLSYAEVAEVRADVARRGKRGMNVIARLLDERSDEQAPSESYLEALLHELISRDHQLPPLVRQFDHPGFRPGERRVDGAWLDAMVIVEADGRPYHQRLADLTRDAERDRRAAMAGWQTVRIHWVVLKNHAAQIRHELRVVRSTRLRQFGRAA